MSTRRLWRTERASRGAQVDDREERRPARRRRAQARRRGRGLEVGTAGVEERAAHELVKQLEAQRMEFGMYQSATKAKLGELQQHKKILKR